MPAPSSLIRRIHRSVDRIGATPRCAGAASRCDDVEFTPTRISAADLPPARAREFAAIATRLTLPPALIRQSIDAGRDAAQANGALQRYKATRRPPP